MRNLVAPVLVSVTAWTMLSACRVERTPDEYFDHERSIEAARAEAGGEVRDRLLSFVASAGRGDATQALVSLHPADGVQVVAPAGLAVSGGAAMRGVLTQLVATPVAVRVREVEVEVGPAGGVAWFRLVVEAPGTTPEPSLYHATGTYLRDAGLWELVQAHVSGPITSDSSSTSQSDSVATPAGAE